MSTLNIAATGLLAFRKATELTSNNIANANTEGFIKDRAIFSELPRVDGIGSGVRMDPAKADGLLDNVNDAILDIETEVGYGEGVEDGLALVPVDSFTDIMDKVAEFKNSTAELADDPDSAVIRTKFISASNDLMNSVNSLNQTFDNSINSINKSIGLNQQQIDVLKDSDDFADQKEWAKLEGYNEGLKAVADEIIPNIQSIANIAIDTFTGRINEVYKDGTNQNGDTNTLLFNDGAVVPQTARDVSAGTTAGDNSIAMGMLEAIDGGNRSEFSTIRDELIQADFTFSMALETNTGDLSRDEFYMKQLKAAKQEQYGVDLDQEAVNLLKYKQAYEAMAKVIKADDEMFRSLLNVV